MKCDKYIHILDDFNSRQLTVNETNDLKRHLQTCETCRKEYEGALRYNSIINLLKQNQPLFTDKEGFIESVLNKLPDKNQSETVENNLKVLIPYRIRLALTSMAAALVLFFTIQQASDAWQIRQLETRSIKRKTTIDYTIVKAGILVDLFEDNTKQNQGIMIKIKNRLKNEAFVNVNSHFPVLTETQSKRLPDIRFILPEDSNIHQ